MNFKNILNNFFGYKPPNSYKFSLPDNSDNENSVTSQDSAQIPSDNVSQTVYPSIDVNLDYIKSKYNLLINSDVKTREFILNARGKQYKALILYIDGMVNTRFFK